MVELIPFFFTLPEFFDGSLSSNLEFQLCPSSNVTGLTSSIILRLTTWRIQVFDISHIYSLSSLLVLSPG